MRQNVSWDSVVIGQKGSIVLPKDMVSLAGEYMAYDLALRYELPRSGHLAAVSLELRPRFVDEPEKASVTSRRRLYIGRALSILGFDHDQLQQTPREVRTVTLGYVRKNHTAGLYLIDLTDMVDWKCKQDRLKRKDAAEPKQDLNRAPTQGAQAGGFLRRFFLASKRYLLAEDSVVPPAHRAPEDCQPSLPVDYLKGRGT